MLQIHNFQVCLLIIASTYITVKALRFKTILKWVFIVYFCNWLLQTYENNNSPLVATLTLSELRYYRFCHTYSCTCRHLVMSQGLQSEGPPTVSYMSAVH